MSLLDPVTPLWRARLDALLQEKSVLGVALVSSGVTLFDLLHLHVDQANNIILLAEEGMRTRHGVRSRREHSLRICITFPTLSLICVELGPLMLIVLFEDNKHFRPLSNFCFVILAEMIELIPADLDWEIELDTLHPPGKTLGGLTLTKLPRSRTLVHAWSPTTPLPVLKFSQDLPATATRPLPLQKFLGKETMRINVPTPRPPVT